MPSILDITSGNYSAINSKSMKSVSVPTGGVAGMSSANVAQEQHEISKFQSLIDGINAGISEKKTDSTLSSSQIGERGRLNGDYSTSLKNAFTNEADKTALPSGAASNAVGAHGVSASGTVDKTSELYKKALELESYFVKIMLSSMRSTVTKTNLTGKDNQYAQNMYEDMMYDELSTTMTKSAGFGLADQIYIQLSGNS